MAVDTCAIVVVEGTHASGKTTLALALATACAARGLDARFVGDSARTSPYCNEVVVHQHGRFRESVELDLLFAHAQEVWRAAWQAQVVICDKGSLSIPVYARELARVGRGDFDEAGLQRLDQLSALVADVYDLVLLCEDRFDGSGDAFRSKVAGLQDTVGTSLREAVGRASLVSVPQGLPTATRVGFSMAHILEAIDRVGQ